MGKKSLQEPLSDEALQRLSARRDELEGRRRLKGQARKELRNIVSTIEQHSVIVERLLSSEQDQRQRVSVKEKETHTKEIPEIERAQQVLDERMETIREESKPLDFQSAKKRYDGGFHELAADAIEVYSQIGLAHPGVTCIGYIEKFSNLLKQKWSRICFHSTDITSFISGAPISKKWAGLTRACQITLQNFSMDWLQKRIIDGRSVVGHLTPKQASFSVFDASIDALIISGVNGGCRDNRWSVTEHYQYKYYFTSCDKLIEMMTSQKETFVDIVSELSYRIAGTTSRSKEEANLRIHDCLTILASDFSDLTGSRVIPEPHGDRCAELMFERVPQVLNYAAVQDELEIFAPELLNTKNGLENVAFMFVKGKLVCTYAEHCADKVKSLKDRLEKYTFDKELPKMDAAEIQNTLFVSPDERLDEFNRRVKSYPAKSFVMPTVAELESQFFSPTHYDEKFLAKAEETVEPDDDIDEGSSAKSGSSDVIRIPRLRALRETLLRNAISATFAWDDGKEFVEGEEDFAEVPEGRYVIVTLPDPGLQFVISDDQGKGTYVVYNTISPSNYADVSVRDLKENFAGTPQRWDTREQFIRSIENTILQQSVDPKTVYPINVSPRCVTPLTHFPSEQAIEILRHDFQEVAERAKKGKKPWTLRKSDVEGIKSGEFLWSFGGNACGGAQLDRLAREFGLSERETGVPQHQFRVRIFRMLLHEMYPEYRERKQELDQEKVADIEYAKASEQSQTAPVA